MYDNLKMNKPTQDLLKRVPEGLVTSRKKLLDLGFTSSSVDFFLRTGKLESVAHGIYRRPGPPLKWEHVVYSINELGYPVHVGGRSALDLQGFAHHLPLTGMIHIHLFSSIKLPAWVSSNEQSYNLEVHVSKLIGKFPDTAIIERPFGHWDWPIPYATPELALLELLDGIKTESDFKVADTYFESATTLRPKLLNQLLESCKKVIVNRLFLWFGERHNHQWIDGLNVSEVNVGSGKRMVIRDGTLDSKYQITVPKVMASGDQANFY